MQALHVKVLAPTEKQPMRYKATGLDMCKVIPKVYSLNAEGNAAYAAQELVDDYNMQHPSKPLKILGVGCLPDNTYAVLLATK